MAVRLNEPPGSKAHRSGLLPRWMAYGEGADGGEAGVSAVRSVRSLGSARNGQEHTGRGVRDRCRRLMTPGVTVH